MEYRFFCLQSHYRKSLVFSEENLENAAVAYRKLKAKVLALSDEGEADAEAAARYRKNFADALGNDLNTSLAVTAVYDVLKAKDLSGSAKRALIGEFDRVLSLDLLKREEKEETPATSELSAQEIEAYIASRALAKKEKNYAEADRIRDLLAQKGVSLVDTPSGTTYKIER